MTGEIDEEPLGDSKSVKNDPQIAIAVRYQNNVTSVCGLNINLNI